MQKVINVISLILQIICLQSLTLIESQEIMDGQCGANRERFMNNIDIIDKLIDDILEDKKAFGEEFNVNALGAYNLRKTSFSDIINDDEFVHHIIPNYISKLKSFIDQEQLLVFWLSKYDFQYRVKNPDTVFLKIKQYSEREKEKGKLQLKKSLNDLFGIRIILPGIISNKNNILLFLEREKENQKISRYYLREDGNYCGIHCYFAKDNFTFPWELQIWDAKSKADNYDEHELHEVQRKEESEGIFT